MVVTSCSGAADPATTTTTTTDMETTTSTTAAIVEETTTTTSSTTIPDSGPPLAVQGDTNETVEAFQFLLNCSGFGDLTVDGVFGPATLAAVQAAQESLGRPVDGAPDDALLADLSRSCSDSRRIEAGGVVTVVGNAAPTDPEIFQLALLSDSTVSLTVIQGTGLGVTVRGADGQEVPVEGQSTYSIATSQDYTVAISSPSGPATFTLTVNVTEGVREVGDWILATNGISYRGTKLLLGSDAQTVIDQIFDFLGHGVRGGYEEFDTGWYPITEPQPLGLRGIRIEGFAFLFHGPDPSNPDRPETFARHRFFGAASDSAGDPRPDGYATTAEGITIGDTVVDLKDAYGDDVVLGHTTTEYYYQFTDSGGELCFYFEGAEEPTDFSPIVEIASECRSG